MEIAALSPSSKGAASLKPETRKISVHPVIIGAEDLRQLSAAKFIEIAEIRTGNDIHPEFPGFLWVNYHTHAV